MRMIAGKYQRMALQTLGLVLFFAFFFVKEGMAQQTHTFNTGTNVLWTVPAGVTSIQVETWGGGGRGSTRTNNGAGGGGGGGAYSRSVIAVTPGQQFYYTVGTGSNNNSNPGGDSYFSTSMNASGAVVLAKGGGTVANNTTAGATGGQASSGVGQFLFSGGNGASGSGSNGGGGGSSAGTANNGANGSGSTGGSAPSGGGSGGNGRTGTQGVGLPGTPPGGGGGGAYRSSSQTRDGGNGAAGRVVITELISITTTFETPGSTQQWTVPAGVTKIQVETWGGGGRGGQRSNNNGGAGGGGGGGYSRSVLTVTPNTTYYISVGAGSAGTGAGGDSWFSTTNATGGSVVRAKGGTSVANNSANGVAGGASTGGTNPALGDVRVAGGNGANGTSGASGGGGGGGGGNASGSTGGTSTTGGGNGANGPTSGNVAGNTGGAPGGGGSGARRTSGSTTWAGGSGANGQVIIKVLDADISIMTSSSSMTPDVGSNVTLTFTVTNHGSETANGIVMTEIAPSGLTYVSHAAPSQGTVNTGNSTWNIGSLAKDATATLNVTFAVQSTGDYTNQASITAEELDLNMGNNSSSITLFPVTPTSNLRITKEADNYHPLVGDQVIFTLTAYNSGPQNATNVLVTDQLPSGLTYQNHSGGTYNNTTGEWSIGSLVNGGDATLTITATVAATGSYTNQATISGDQFDPATNNNTSSISVFPTYAPVTIELDCEDTTYDLTSFTDDYAIGNIPPGANLTWHTASEATSGNIYGGNLSAAPTGTYYLAFYDPVLGCYSLTTEVTIENNCADLGIDKTVNNPTPTVGQTLTFTLTITNHGPADATGIVVVDEVPNGYGDIANISNGGVWDAGNRTITWTGLSIANAANQAMTYQAKVLAKGDGISHTNTASVTALDQTDHNPSNDTDTLVLDPRPSLLITNPMIRQRVTGGG